jgi:hypothetical protein
MEEVENVGRGRPEALDLVFVECANGREEFALAGAAGARVQKVSEGNLVVSILVDVGNAELGFPQKRMVRTPKDLTLLSDRTHHRLERLALVSSAEGTVIDLRNHLLDATAYGSEILETLFPQKPSSVGAFRIRTPLLQ